MIVLHFFQNITYKSLKKQHHYNEGKRNCQGFWDIPLTNTNAPPPTKKQRTQQLANGIIHQRQTKVELAEHLSGSCFGPAKSTLIRAIKNHHFISWPGMTQEPINKHLPKLVAIAKGHLDQEAKKLQSTKNKVTPVEHDIGSPQENDNEKTDDIIVD